MTEKLTVLADEIAHWQRLRDAALAVAEHAGSVAGALTFASWDARRQTFLLPALAVDERARVELAIENLDRAR